MDHEILLKETIPNPFQSDSTLADPFKKGTILKEGQGIFNIVKNNILLIGFGFFLHSFLNLPIKETFLFIGMNLLVSIGLGHIKLAKIKALYQINTQNILEVAKKYKTILIANEYYGVIESVISLVVPILGIFFLRSFILGNNKLLYFTGIFLFFNILNILARYIKYLWIKDLSEKEELNFAQVDQYYRIISKKMDLVHFIPRMGLFSGIVYYLGFPMWVLMMVIVATILFVSMSIIEWIRIKNVSLDIKNTMNSPVEKIPVKTYLHEYITSFVFGILRISSGWRDFLKPAGKYFLGTGKNFYPENSLIITSMRILIIQIPLVGTDNIVDDKDYVLQNFFYNRKEMIQQGEKLLQTGDVSTFFPFIINEVLFQEIEMLTIKKTGQVIIEKESGEKMAYFFFEKEKADFLYQACYEYLKDRCVII